MRVGRNQLIHAHSIQLPMGMRIFVSHLIPTYMPNCHPICALSHCGRTNDSVSRTMFESLLKRRANISITRVDELHFIYRCIFALCPSGQVGVFFITPHFESLSVSLCSYQSVPGGTKCACERCLRMVA